MRSLFILWFMAGVALAESRPNIVLIMCDDMGYSDIGCYGGEVSTPTLDRLAKEGTRFTQFYNNAKCTTTRASLVTGLWPRKQLLTRNMLTLGEALKDAGYRTALSGKWHLGSGEDTHPWKRGFEEFYGLLDGCCNFFNPIQPDPPYKGNRVRKFGRNGDPIKTFPEDYYTTDAFTDHAIACVKKFSTEEKPFFLHVTYTAPHYPLHAKPEDIQQYIGKYKMGWFAMREQRFARMKEMGLATDSWKLSAKDRGAYDWQTSNQDFEDLRQAVYAAMIDSMDQNIGRLMEALKQSGEADNTLVLFLSDNGGCAEEPGGRDPAKRNPGPGDDYVCVGPAWGWAQNAPFKKHKSRTHEGGVCTPMIAWWPGTVPANVFHRAPAHIIDFMPTFLELAGADYPSSRDGNDLLPLDGKSMLALLKGETREPHAYLAWEWAGSRAYREGDWKAVWDPRGKAWELFNLASDRCETTDLSGKHPERTARLAAAWDGWNARTRQVRTGPKKKKN